MLVLFLATKAIWFRADIRQLNGVDDKPHDFNMFFCGYTPRLVNGPFRTPWTKMMGTVPTCFLFLEDSVPRYGVHKFHLEFDDSPRRWVQRWDMLRYLSGISGIHDASAATMVGSCWFKSFSVGLPLSFFESPLLLFTFLHQGIAELRRAWVFDHSTYLGFRLV